MPSEVKGKVPGSSTSGKWFLPGLCLVTGVALAVAVGLVGTAISLAPILLGSPKEPRSSGVWFYAQINVTSSSSPHEDKTFLSNICQSP